MLKQDIYAIYTEDDERRGSIKELFSSFEEAMEARCKYANFFRPKGDVWIYTYDAYKPFYPSYSCHVCVNGEIDYVN